MAGNDHVVGADQHRIDEAEPAIEAAICAIGPSECVRALRT
jgi:hypothetical protein